MKLTAFVTHGFEDFQITEPDCSTQDFSTWLMYGGRAESNTMYCCPGEANRETRAESLKIEGIDVPLVDDRTLQQFRVLLKTEPDTTARATVIGTFFSGTKVARESSTSWQGYGHLGCCSLLVIQLVESFQPHRRTDLDYTAEAGWYEGEGCKLSGEQDLKHVSVNNWRGDAQSAIAEQREADSGQGWRFSDPQRVALESFNASYPGQVPAFKLVKKAEARRVFRWRNGKKSVVIVVTRPYWLSFYAASESVAWVSTMIKEGECK